jgi:hypothetical protein
MWTWQVEAMWSAFKRDPSESQATATSFMRHAFPADMFISRTLGQSEPGASAADAYWQSSKDAKSVAKTCILNITFALRRAERRFASEGTPACEAMTGRRLECFVRGHSASSFG